MPDIATLVDNLNNAAIPQRVASNRLASFGTPSRQLLGARILPPQDQPENRYTDDMVRYRTFIANAGDRYSPVQLKRGVWSGSVNVDMFDSDIGSELNSRDYEALMRMADRSLTIQATAQIISFLDLTANQPLEELREVYRWQAIEKALVRRYGHNKYFEPIGYADPAGHRVIAAHAWSDNAYDPMTDIFAIAQMLRNKGYAVDRVVTSMRVMGILGMNEIMRSRAGTIRMNVANGQLMNVSSMASMDQIQSAFISYGLPAPELYDLVYRTQDNATNRFISDDVMIFLGTTGRDVNFETGVEQPAFELLPNTLGYYAVGKGTGQPTPGRVLQLRAFDDRPPRVTSAGWEAGCPVILEPEAIAVIKSIA
jgi:hypothetical protein